METSMNYRYLAYIFITEEIAEFEAFAIENNEYYTICNQQNTFILFDSELLYKFVLQLELARILFINNDEIVK